MTSRRDLLKIASALGLAATVPSSADRIAVMQILDQEVSANVLLDPGGFGEEVDGIFGSQLDWLGAITSEEHAAYAKKREQLRQAVPLLGKKEGLRAFGDWEAAYFQSRHVVVLRRHSSRRGRWSLAASRRRSGYRGSGSAG